jgi:hypothetical protein
MSDYTLLLPPESTASTPHKVCEWVLFLIELGLFAAGLSAGLQYVHELHSNGAFNLTLGLSVACVVLLLCCQLCCCSCQVVVAAVRLLVYIALVSISAKHIESLHLQRRAMGCFGGAALASIASIVRAATCCFN